MTGSEDQKLDLSYGHIFIYIYIYCQFIYMYSQYICYVFFIKCVLSANLRYSSHMHQLINFDFMEYD